jgi:hypothetical protein
MSEPFQNSKGIAVTNWLVNKAAGLLERKSSRRGFLIGSAMAGSAVAVAGCVPITTPGSPYKHITDCAGGLCTDGYTEFCCAINNGVNACPPGSFPGGWWRADYSSFCNGTRYYVDCMQDCCGPRTGYQNFCAGCVECRCAADCNTRRVYCNYFRYGQCHQEIVASGPIACRVVTCTPPYNDASNACSTAAAVDNSTAEHAGNCASPLLLPVVGAAATPNPGRVFVFARAFSGRVSTRAFDGSSWSSWSEISPTVTSGLASAADSSNMYVAGRGTDNYLWYNQFTNGAWSGERRLDGLLAASDPFMISDADGVHLFVRSVDQAVWYARLVNGVWSGWVSLRGGCNADPAAASSPTHGRFAFIRGTDNQLWCSRQTTGDWSIWEALAGSLASAPTAAADSTGVYVFVRGTDDAIWYRKFDGSWGPWQLINGNCTGHPFAVADANGPYVFVRGGDGRPWCNRLVNGTWTGFQLLNGTTNASPTAVADSTGVYAFIRGDDNALWYGRYTGGGWSGFQSLGGVVVAVDALNP